MGALNILGGITSINKPCTSKEFVREPKLHLKEVNGCNSKDSRVNLVTVLLSSFAVSNEYFQTGFESKIS